MPSGAAPANRLDSATVITVGVLGCSMLLGGGGYGAPLMELLLQLVLAGLVAVWAWVLPPGRLSALPRALWLLAALIVALPALQLIPLPPSVWHALPGRELEIAALGLIGQQNSWQPISLAPMRTLACLLCMIAAAAMLVMTAALTRQGRTLLLVTIVGIALVSLVAGAVRLTGDHGAMLGFYVANSNHFIGFQSYRNSEAEVLLVAITATAAIARDLAGMPRWQGRKRRLIGLTLVVTVLLVLGVFHAGSRTGIALLAIALPAQLVILRPIIRLSWRNTLIGAALCAGVMILSALALWHNPMIAGPLARFNAANDARPEIWKDALFAARAYFPWGAGMGSFVPVYAAVERLNLVDVYTTNRAHNDYLELLIEGGLFAVAWGMTILKILVRAALDGLRRGELAARGQVICAVAALCQLGLHSLIDYPLRSMAISAIAAAVAGLLFPSPERAEPEEPA